MIGRFLGSEVPATGFSLGFERLVDLVALAEDSEPDAAALLYDADVAPAALAALKTELIATGVRTRLEKRPRNQKGLLDQLAAAGFTRFAVVTAATTSVADLEFRALG